MMFNRIFWAFRPCIKGFPHCRPLISIDGTYLYGKYRGTLMIAMAIDANSQFSVVIIRKHALEGQQSMFYLKFCNNMLSLIIFI